MKPSLPDLLKLAGLAGLAISPFLGVVPASMGVAGDLLTNLAASGGFELLGLSGEGLRRRFFNKLGQPNHHLNKALQLAILDALQEIDLEKEFRAPHLTNKFDKDGGHAALEDFFRALRRGDYTLVLPDANNATLIRFLEDATEENFQQLAKEYPAAAFPGLPSEVPEFVFRRLHSAVAARFWDRVKNDAPTWHAYATEIFGEMRDSLARIEGKQDQLLAMINERETLVLRSSGPADVSPDLLAAIEAQWEKWQAETLRIRRQLDRIEAGLAATRVEVIKNRHLGLKAFSVILLLFGGIYCGIHLLRRDVETLPGRVEHSIRKGYTVDVTRIRIQLEGASQNKRDEDIAEANDIAKHPKWDDRQKLREEAEAAHQQRISRVTQYAEDFAELASAQDASPILIEMGRIIETEGVDAAIAYFETERGDVFKRAESRLSSLHDAVRRDLQPSLKAAGLLSTKGDSTAARATYQKILTLEPDWPEAIDEFGWFLRDASAHSASHGSQQVALADAEAMLTLATHRQALSPNDHDALRLSYLAYTQTADVLKYRGQPGDAAQVLDYYQRCHEISQKLLAAFPNVIEFARDESFSLERLGQLLNSRSQPGDATQALDYFQRCYDIREKLLNANPHSPQAASDVSLILNKLGDLLAVRNQPGDAEKALAHFQRSLDLREKNFNAHPDSADAMRDFSTGLGNLGAFLSRRGKPGDTQQALSLLQRSLEIDEKLLAASPNSAQTSRDVSVNLNKIGDILVRRAQPGDAEKALAHFQRSLDLRVKLLAANPDSALAAQDLVITQYMLATFAQGRGDASEEIRYRRASYEILAPRIARGMTFNPKILILFEQLKQQFGEK